MAEKKILVTGAFGLVGTDLILRLCKYYSPKNVVAVSHKTTHNFFDVPVEKGDVTNPVFLDALIKKHNIGEIYHLAGLLSVGSEENPQLAWQVNLGGLKNILDVAVAHKLKVFWPSSIAAFGPTTPRENTPQHTVLEPTTMYGVNKVAGELLCQYYFLRYGLDVRSLRFRDELIAAEEEATQKFGTGPGAVRFISGTLKIHRDLEKAIAKFHGRDDAIVFSSAFAANIAVMSCFLNKQSKDSLISKDVVVISDALNHRSIIDGIRAASIDKSQKLIYQHMDYEDLISLLEQNKKNFKRAVVASDGVFSMIGEYANIKKLREIVDRYDKQYEEGVLLVIDDSHGVGAFGKTGRGCEEISNGKADLLVATFGKAFGSDGGYIAGDQVLIDYLRESAATYIYSNSISPGVAGAALQAVTLIDTHEGKSLLLSLSENIAFFQKGVQKAGFQFVTDSIHPIQPLLVGDTLKTKQLKEELYKAGILVTNINYPVVAKGKDEIRIQINASHTKEDITYFIKETIRISKKIGFVN